MALHLIKRWLLAFALLPFLALANTPKDILVMAYSIDDIISLDPAEMFEFSGLEYAANTYDRLITYDNNDVSKISGMAVKSWSISKDGKMFTFTMRPGIVFASGNKMTADDAVFSLRRVIRLNKSPAFILQQFGLNEDNVNDNIKKIDEMTFSITLDKSYSPSFFLYCLTSGIAAVVDKKTVMRHAKNGDYGNGWLKTNYAGSGPFMLKSWKPHESLSYTANSNYWNGAPKLKGIFVKHIKESSVQRLLLEKGDIDIARNLESDQLKGVLHNDKIKIMQSPKGSVYYFALNQKNRYLSNPKVRLALKYLVDYQGMVNSILDKRAVIHQTFLPLGFLGAIKDTPYHLDINKAKALLKQSGYADGFTLTMDVRNTTLITNIAKSLQSTWDKAGIKLEIIPGDGKQTLTKYRARKHDIYIGRWAPDYQDPNSNAQTFASNPDNSDDSKLKTLAWRNSWYIPEMTKTTKNAILIKDTAERAKVYEQLQRQALKESPFIIMFQEIENIAMQKHINGFEPGPSYDSNYYKKITK